MTRSDSRFISSHEPARVAASMPNIFSDPWKKNKISVEGRGGWQSRTEQSITLEINWLLSNMQGSIFLMPCKGTGLYRGKKLLLQFLSALKISNILPKDFSMHLSIDIFLTSVSEREKKKKKAQTTDSVVVYAINSDVNMSNNIIF